MEALPVTGRIDVHSHLLPGVDDGCADVADSIRCGRILAEAGYSHAFCTPHIWPNLTDNNVDQIGRRVAELQGEYDRAGVKLTLMPGGEMNLLVLWPALQTQSLERIVTYGLRGKYALFDFWAGSLGECAGRLLPAIAFLQGLGLTPVLAHPERVAALNRDPAALDRLAGMGVLLQLNSYTLAEPPDSPIHQTAVRLLRGNKYFLMGSDTHNSGSMPSRIAGLRIARELAGDQTVDELTITNPRKVMGEGT